MSNPLDRTLADWMKIAERKRRNEQLARLGIPEHLRIEGLQLEALSYHLTERSGHVQLKLEGYVLRVGEPGRPGGIPYRGDAIWFLLRAWEIAAEEARAGIVIEVENGVRRR